MGVSRRMIFFGLLLTLSMGAEDFITEFEYGQMLYRNPRGASCVACHGETGEGRVIATYTDKAGKQITLNGPDIRNATLEQIRRSVQEGKSVMPRYFLTEKELKTIYAYLQKVNGRKENNISKLFKSSE